MPGKYAPHILKSGSFQKVNQAAPPTLVGQAGPANFTHSKATKKIINNFAAFNNAFYCQR